MAYWLLNDSIGWRGLLWVSVLPAPLLLAYIRYFVKEPPVSVENRKRQRDGNQEVRAPLAAIFRRGLRFNTFTACWWMTGHMLIYYSIYGLFATWLQSELRVPAAAVAAPVLLNNLVVFGAAFVWGAITDRIGRRVTIIIQALSGCVVAPLYLLSGNLNVILVGFVAQGFFGASVTLMAAAYMPERFPTEVRATASAFCYHFGLFFGALVPAVASYFAVEQHMGFAVPMLIGYLIGAATVVSALLLSPETKGKVFVADLMKQ